jgi:hypothetical protein
MVNFDLTFGHGYMKALPAVYLVYFLITLKDASRYTTIAKILFPVAAYFAILLTGKFLASIGGFLARDFLGLPIIFWLAIVYILFKLLVWFMKKKIRQAEKAAKQIQEQIFSLRQGNTSEEGIIASMSKAFGSIPESYHGIYLFPLLQRVLNVFQTTHIEGDKGLYNTEETANDFIMLCATHDDEVVQSKLRSRLEGKYPV